MENVDDAARPDPPPSVRPEDMRAGDADREQVLERLSTAHAEGRIDLQEFDERVVATLAARTYGELAALTEDLPGDPPTPRPLAVPQRSLPPDRAEEARRGMRAAAAGWVGLSLVTFVIWVVMAIASGGLTYPFLLVIGPYAAVLLASWVGSRLQR
jgi:Domain of unknown function (DUF1707)